MLNYWQHNVLENFLPPIDPKRRTEIEMRKSQVVGNEGPRITSATTKKLFRQNSASHSQSDVNKFRVISWRELGVDL
jgi:hypothetical protein